MKKRLIERIISLPHMIIILLCIIEIQTMFLWRNVSKFFQVCKQDPFTSFPCYGIIDLAFIWILILLLIISIIVNLIIFYNNKN